VDGKSAQLGYVENFHTYKGQPDDHGKYDQWTKWQWLWAPMNPANPDSFNPLYGARQARDKAARFTEFWVAATKWEDGVQDWFYTQVFPFSSTITPADNTV
jgi:hypothetical protein